MQMNDFGKGMSESFVARQGGLQALGEETLGSNIN
jgi:hypothetical protein